MRTGARVASDNKSKDCTKIRRTCVALTIAQIELTSAVIPLRKLPSVLSQPAGRVIPELSIRNDHARTPVMRERLPGGKYLRALHLPLP
jgi:hypothetical protein